MKYVFPYFGPVFLEMKAEESLIKRLISVGKKNRKEENNVSHLLSGSFNNEYSMDNLDWFKSEFEEHYKTYMGALYERLGENAHKGKKPIGWELDALWINYQGAKDHNPTHNHSGDISFVIYLKIPDELVKEKESMEGKTNYMPGSIAFDYQNDERFSITSYAKLPEEGDVFMFPSWLKHSVMSFNSDVERVSVAGNIYIKYDNQEL